MSYDLMVFEPEKAPRKQGAFMKWYDQQTEWTEGHSYDDPTVSSSGLQEWYKEMIQTFPPMNGPDSPDEKTWEEDEASESHLTDYAIGRDVIYAAFSWSLAEEAYEKVKSLAQKHGVGFFNPSSDAEEIIRPDGNPTKQCLPKWLRFYRNLLKKR